MFFVYMLKCKDGSLYIGQTIDLDLRLRQHTDGAGSKYVRGRRPFRLAYVEKVSSRSEALKREMSLRKLSKAQKEDLAAEWFANTT